MNIANRKMATGKFDIDSEHGQIDIIDLDF